MSEVRAHYYMYYIFRYFNPSNYYAGGSYEEIWDNMGEDIFCNVNDDLTGEGLKGFIPFTI